MTAYFLTALILMISNLIEAMTGFGSSVLALPFLSGVIGLKTSVAIIRFVSLVMGFVIAIINRKKINFKELGKILLFVGLGMPIGIYAFSNVDEKLMSIFLGIFITCYASYTIIKWFISRKKTVDETKKEETAFHKVISFACLFFGGIVHGALATGGPFIVVYTGAHLKDKDEFRATMCSVWAVINTCVMAVNILQGGVYTVQTFKYTAFAAIFIVVGAAAGFFFHKKISGKGFSLAVDVMLLISGVSTIIQALK